MGVIWLSYMRVTWPSESWLIHETYVTHVHSDVHDYVSLMLEWCNTGMNERGRTHDSVSLMYEWCNTGMSECGRCMIDDHWLKGSKRLPVLLSSRLLKIIGLFGKKTLLKRLCFAQETYHFKEPTNRSHPIPLIQRIKEIARVAFESDLP